jgi:RNA polymerase sigma-70 factor, ECF subfamily
LWMLQAAANSVPAPRGFAQEHDSAASAEREEELRWIRAAQSGDRAAFTRLYERFAPVVHGVLLARVRRGDADDLVQDVFVAVWRRISELRDAAAFPAWVLTIARNAAATRARAGRATVAISERLPAPAEQRGDAAAECERVLGVIRDLPEAYRETLTLRLVEGLGGEQIAACTGMTHGSVRVNLHRGMALLRERLGGTTGEDVP